MSRRSHYYLFDTPFLLNRVYTRADGHRAITEAILKDSVLAGPVSMQLSCFYDYLMDAFSKRKIQGGVIELVQTC